MTDGKKEHNGFIAALKNSSSVRTWSAFTIGVLSSKVANLPDWGIASVGFSSFAVILAANHPWVQRRLSPDYFWPWTKEKRISGLLYDLAVLRRTEAGTMTIRDLGWFNSINTQCLVNSTASYAFFMISFVAILTYSVSDDSWRQTDLIMWALQEANPDRYNNISFVRKIPDKYIKSEYLLGFIVSTCYLMGILCSIASESAKKKARWLKNPAEGVADTVKRLRRLGVNPDIIDGDDI